MFKMLLYILPYIQRTVHSLTVNLMIGGSISVQRNKLFLFPILARQNVALNVPLHKKDLVLFLSAYPAIGGMKHEVKI